MVDSWKTPWVFSFNIYYSLKKKNLLSCIFSSFTDVWSTYNILVLFNMFLTIAENCQKSKNKFWVRTEVYNILFKVESLLNLKRTSCFVLSMLLESLIWKLMFSVAKNQIQSHIKYFHVISRRANLATIFKVHREY